MKESQLQAEVKKMIRRHGGEALKWSCPGTTGVPDMLGLLPGGLLLIVEVKKPGAGRLSPRQEIMISLLKGLGFWVEVIDSREKLADVESQIELLC